MPQYVRESLAFSDGDMEEIAMIEALTLSDAIARSKNELTLSDAIVRSKNEMLSNFSEAAQEVQFQPQELVE